MILSTSELLLQAPRSTRECRDLPHKHALSGCAFCRENGVFKEIQKSQVVTGAPESWPVHASLLGPLLCPDTPVYSLLLKQTGLHSFLPLQFPLILRLQAPLFPCSEGSSRDPAHSKHCLPPSACCGTTALVLVCLQFTRLCPGQET